MTDLSPFNSFYELAAAVTSALAGFKVVQDFLVERLERDSDSLQKDAEKTLAMLKAVMEQMSEYITNTPDILKTDSAVMSLIQTTTNGHTWCEVQAKELSSEHEKEVLANMATSLFFYAFLFYATILVTNGLSSSGLISNVKDVAFTVNLSTVVIVAMIVLTFMKTSGWRTRPIWLCIWAFPASIGISFAITIYSKAEPVYVYAVCASIAISLLPLMVMLISRRIAWAAKKPTIESGLQAREAEAEKVTAFLTDRLSTLRH